MPVIVLAPHPDDETLGCGGALLRHVAAGESVHWCVVTAMGEGYSAEQQAKRDSEIDAASARYGFAQTHQLGFPTTTLDTVPQSELVRKIGAVFSEVKPTVVYVPHRGDAHSDHAAVFDAAAACCKWFRYPSVKRVLVYETLSETDFGLSPDANGFRPNVFADITPHLEAKLEIMRIFASEMGRFPFPRSEEAIRALAALRGAACGCSAAEAFMLLREIV